MRKNRLKLKKHLTKPLRFVYNICCHCKKRALCLLADTLPIPTLRRCHYAQNLPTQKASEKERAWFQKENENCRRQKRSEEKTCKGQKETDLLISCLSHSNETKKWLVLFPHRPFFAIMLSLWQSVVAPIFHFIFCARVSVRVAM